MKKILQVLIMLLCSNAVFASSCPANKMPATANENLAKSLATYLNSKELNTVLDSKFCFDESLYNNQNSKSNNPAFFISTTEQLNFYLNLGMPIDSYKEVNNNQVDLLSYLIISNNIKYANTPEEQKEYFNLITHYIPTYTDKKINKYIPPASERQQLLEYVSNIYNNKRVFIKSSFGFNPLQFAIINNDYFVLNNLLKNSSSFNLSLYKKDKFGFTPYHYAFITKYNPSSLSKADLQKNLELSNNILINNLEANRISFLKINRQSFFQFASLMKDKNPDFYNKLQAKFKFNYNTGVFPGKPSQDLINGYESSFYGFTKIIENANE